MDYVPRITALMQLTLSPQTWDGVLHECTAIEADNPYIPSGYLWVIEYKRYQIALAKGFVFQAIAHLKTVIGLVPYDDQMVEEYVRLCQRESDIDCLVLIMASKSNELHALELAKNLDEMDIPYAIVTGTKSEAILHPRAVQVDVPDNYENLGRKVIAAYTWVYENLSPDMAILQIKDTMQIDSREQFLHALAQLKQKNAYVGLPVEMELEFDRCYHWGKCADPELNSKVYDRPYYGSWAQGDAYYLSSGLMAKLVLSMIRFPALFEGEYFADKLIGDTLIFEGIALSPITNYAEMGLAFNTASYESDAVVEGGATV